MLAFLRAMPKGGDLHSHLSGAVYAESYIRWGAADGACVSRTTLAASAPPCDAAAGQVPLNTALTDASLYRALVDGWSTRAWRAPDPSGYGQFFDAFGKFSPTIAGHGGDMLAEVVARAARGGVSYLELMITADTGISSRVGQQVGWDHDLESTFLKLKNAGLDSAIGAADKTIHTIETGKNQLLRCGSSSSDPGCSVTVRYISQAFRAAPLEVAFAQMITAFALADRGGSSKFVALNLVQPEDTSTSMQNFRAHMDMLEFLRKKFPRAGITLHAGELAAGLVPPDGLSFHIRQSVTKGGATRIGHGVAVMHEDDAENLLRDMAKRRVAVEICLSSNDIILGISGPHHPLKTYLKYGVPVVIATDDEGVSRSEISREFLRAAAEHGLVYLQLKAIARNSIEHAFVESVEKSTLRKRLEEQFKEFEGRY
jgi:hypothetical protein